MAMRAGVAADSAVRARRRRLNAAMKMSSEGVISSREYNGNNALAALIIAAF